MEYKVDVSPAVAALVRMDRLARNGRKFLQAVRRPTIASIRQHQRERKGERSTWPPRAASTRARAKNSQNSKQKRRRGSIANLLGTMPGSWAVKITNDEMLLKNRMPFSGVHDKGGTAGNKAVIPARPFAWLSPDFVKQVAKQWEGLAVKAFIKR